MTTSSIINIQMNNNNNNNSAIQIENIQDNKQEYSNNIISTVNTRLELPNQQQQDDKLLLKNAWGTYFYKADKQRDWKQNVIYITSINYVEDFWSFYTHTYGLRDLSNGSDYMIFKVIYKF
jgi:isochorismate hydrolase